MERAEAEPWGRAPGPAVCGRRAGDSCPEWRRRSRSRGRGQRLTEGPRRCPQLLTGEGTERGLGGPGSGALRRQVLVWGVGTPRAIGVRGLRARGLSGAGCLRRGSGWVGSDWVAPDGGVSEQASQPAGVTSPTPSPARTPFLPLPAAPLSRPGSVLPRPSPPICGGGDSPSVTSLSRFLGIGLGSSLERREELTASQALTITLSQVHTLPLSKHTLSLPASLSHSHTATHIQPDCCT